MSKVKSLSKEKVELLIKCMEFELKRSKEIFDEAKYGSPAQAFGYAEGSIEMLIKKLKGEYPII